MGSIFKTDVIYTDLHKFLLDSKLPVYGALLQGESIYDLNINIEGVEILPFEGQLRFKGITCYNSNLEFNCKEFDLSGLDLFLDQTEPKHLELYDVNWNIGDSIVGSAEFVE